VYPNHWRKKEMKEKETKFEAVAGRTYILGSELYCWICTEDSPAYKDVTEEYGNDECCNCTRDIETGMNRDELAGRVICNGPVWKNGKVLRPIK
jgi:hypothetical protein